MSAASDDLAPLLTARAAFLGFVRRRVGDPDLAEDLLQAAYVRALEHRHELRDDESAVAWFHRILRNAIVDHWRRDATRTRALDALAAEAEEAALPDEPGGELCRCFEPLLHTLGEQGARIVRQVDLEGLRPVDVAAAEGITPNAAMVRLHRGRRALRDRLLATCRMCAEHGCLDCSCQRR